MAVERVGGRAERAVAAPAHVAVLALLVEKPTYVYELYQRFDERFGSFVPMSTSAMYQTVDRLERQGMIELLPDDDEDDGRVRRQRKVRYRVSAEGARALRQTLAQDLRGDAFQRELLLRLMSVGVRDARALHDVVDRYERACLDEMGRIPAPRPDAPTQRSAQLAQLRERLVAEERRLALEAGMKWIAYARAQIDALAVGGSRD